jgi:hypothetical protein
MAVFGTTQCGGCLFHVFIEEKMNKCWFILAEISRSYSCNARPELV